MLADRKHQTKAS